MAKGYFHRKSQPFRPLFCSFDWQFIAESEHHPQLQGYLAGLRQRHPVDTIYKNAPIAYSPNMVAALGIQSQFKKWNVTWLSKWVGRQFWTIRAMHLAVWMLTNSASSLWTSRTNSGAARRWRSKLSASMYSPRDMPAMATPMVTCTDPETSPRRFSSSRRPPQLLGWPHLAICEGVDRNYSTTNS